MTEEFPDPRICPAKPDGGPHEWYTSSAPYCLYCRTSPAAVESRFRDWRYEDVVTRLTAALNRLAETREPKW